MQQNIGENRQSDQRNGGEHPVRVFISYAWESAEYRDEVKRFAKELISDGIDARLDVWHMKAGQTIPEFMSAEIRNADKVLIVCSPEYRTKVHAMEEGESINGVGYESMLVGSTLWSRAREREDIEVVVLRGSPKESIPDFLSAVRSVDLTSAEGYKSGYLVLLRRLTDQVEKAPKRGKLPDFIVEDRKPARYEDVEHVLQPGFWRSKLDRFLPQVHESLRRTGALPTPPEYKAVMAYLRELRAAVEADIAKKNYIPNLARPVPRIPAAEERSEDPFVRPIHQVIRGLVKTSEGGDSATAQIAAVNRRSQVIRNLVRTLRKAHEPLILLGDPGTGKSLTLQQTTLALLEKEFGRVYPSAPIFVRLGGFHCEGKATSEKVLDYVKVSVPERMRPWIDALDEAGKLVILFDGMDEMSRDRYTEHTEALSQFAGSRRGRTKTLFSCRITDFSPSFVHRRLVLLPFDRKQITEYLRRYYAGAPILIEGRHWKPKKVSDHLANGDFQVDASNPFTLWLLCFHLNRKQKWPASRTALLEFYCEETFRRKKDDADLAAAFPTWEKVSHEWARFAYQITLRNRGSAIAPGELENGQQSDESRDVTQMIRVGRHCGVLAESIEGEVPLVRFEHHRLQEYFAARYMAEVIPELNWLDKLDAPRWQETLVNLALMDGAPGALRVLESVIRSELTSLPRNGIQHDRELLLADRVELAARIIRERTIAQSAPSLMDALIEAVEFLMKHGNAITQMKMMRACIHLPIPKLLPVLRIPLTSKVDWLQEQARILLSASKQRGGAKLATEIGYDLAHGVLLLRIPAYVKAIRASHQNGSVRSLCAGICCLLANYSFSLAMGGALYVLVCALAEDSAKGHWLQVCWFMRGPWGIGGTAVLLVLVSALTMYKQPQYLWAAVVGTALATPLLVFFIAALWLAPGAAFGLLFAVAFLFYVFGVQALTLAIAGFETFTLASYLGATVQFRQPEDRLTRFVGSAWSRRGFGWWTSRGATLVPFLIFWAVVLLALSYGLYEYVVSLWPILGRTVSAIGSGLGPLTKFFDVIGSIILKIIAGAGMVFVLVCFALYLRAFFTKQQVRRATAKEMSQVVRSLLAAVREKWVGFSIAGAVVGSIILANLGFGSMIARGLALVLCGVLCVVLALQSVHLWHAGFGWRHDLRSHSHTESSWKSLLSAAGAYEQKDILSRSNHETLGVTPAEFLAVLQSAEALIMEEPALSTYWSQRAEMEQIFKQERQG
jgi:hypothetical protein